MSTTKTYLFHELSSYLPLLEGEEFDDLVEDIKQHGQIEPVTIYEGKILDGRNRYRACKILKRDLIAKEWKPSKATGSTPLQYVISENIMRRHLIPAQKVEIGMLLYDEIEKQVKKEALKKRSETQKGIPKKERVVPKGIKGSEEHKIDRESTTAYKVAQKVKVSRSSIDRGKKIKAVAKTEPIIAKEWEKAKKGDIGITEVYEKAQIIEKLPEDVKKEVVKEEPKITFKEAKVIAEIPSVELRKKEIAERVIVKKRQESEIKKKIDIAEGKIIPKEKFFDKDANKLDSIKSVCQRAMNELTFAGLEGYGDFARKECIKMMKILFEHLRKELKKAGEVAPRKVIDVDVD